MTKEIQLVYADVEPLTEDSGPSWKNRLSRRPYHFPARGGSGQDLAIRLEHADESCFFPLGTSDAETAATKARQIHQLILQQGWEAGCQQFARELVLSFEWSANPLLWTYTTIHTLMEDERVAVAAPPLKKRQKILVVEPDEGVRRALCWSVNQQPSLAGIACDAVESFPRALSVHRPGLVLLNRKMAAGLGFSPGNIARLPSGVNALSYSVHGDGDQMFDATPGGAEGYWIKRLKPDRLLEPLFAGKSPALNHEDPLASVKSYFQTFLQASPKNDRSSLAKLSRREREVLELLSKGRVDKEIARALGISVWTVHGYVKSIFERLKVHTRTEAVVRYLEK